MKRQCTLMDIWGPKKIKRPNTTTTGEDLHPEEPPEENTLNLWLFAAIYPEYVRKNNVLAIPADFPDHDFSTFFDMLSFFAKHPLNSPLKMEIVKGDLPKPSFSLFNSWLDDIKKERRQIFPWTRDDEFNVFLSLLNFNIFEFDQSPRRYKLISRIIKLRHQG